MYVWIMNACMHISHLVIEIDDRNRTLFATKHSKKWHSCFKQTAPSAKFFRILYLLAPYPAKKNYIYRKNKIIYQTCIYIPWLPDIRCRRGGSTVMCLLRQTPNIGSGCRLVVLPVSIVMQAHTCDWLVFLLVLPHRNKLEWEHTHNKRYLHNSLINTYYDNIWLIDT